MSKITDDILNKIDIVDVVSRYVKLKRAWSNFSGLSPFQVEKTPSFMVSPSKQIFKDFSSWLWWNVITFLMEIEKIDFWDAIKILAKDANIDLKLYTDNLEKNNKYEDEKEKIKRLHKLAQSFFVDELWKNDNAYKYLKEKRKLDDKIINLFGIWYATDSHYNLLQFLRSKWFNDDDIAQASLAKKNQNWEIYSFFRDRITFPIYDRMQNIIWFSARIINPEDNPKYLNSSEHIAFEKSKILYWLNIAKQYIKEYDTIIIVEWQMDVIALSRLDIPVWVATCGTALTEDHIKLIKRYTENVCLSFDNDIAGQNANVRALKIAYQQWIYPKIFQLPNEFKDIDEFANNNWSKEELKELIDNSKDWFVCIFEMLKRKSNLDSPIDKQKLLNVMFDLISSVENEAIKEHYLQILSEKSLIQLEILRREYKKYQSSNVILQNRQRQNQLKTQTKTYQPDREILVASLFFDDFVNQFIENKELWSGFMTLKDKIIEIIPESKLAKLLLDRENLEEIQWLQLRWENELNGGKEEIKKLQTVKHLVWPIFRDYLQIIIKYPHITDQKKQELMGLRKILW